MKKRPQDSVALFILKALKEKEGIDHIFLTPGFLVDPFLPSFCKAEIRPIIAAHEGGAAYMADGYARASNNFGVCMGIGGPGVSNMVTAIASAYGDRSPVLVIGGKIDPDYEGKGAFQDSSSSSGIDDMAIMRTVTEFAATVPSVKSAGIFLRKAIRVIRDVERLPVFLSVPRNIQKKPYTGRKYVEVDDRPHRVLDVRRAHQVAEELSRATRIAIFAGNGTVRSLAGNRLQEFAEKFSIPVVTTTRAKGAIGEDTRMSFGVFGFGGSLRANLIIAGSKRRDIRPPQVVLILGATLNENNTFEGSMPESAHMILLDINPNSNRDIEYPHKFIMADVLTFLDWMLEHEEYHKALLKTQHGREIWTNKIRDSTEPCEPIEENRRLGIHPGRAITELRKAANENSARDAMLVVDSGAHSFFSAHYWESYAPHEFFVMSTMGPMGYGIAAGIGAKLAQNKKPCICIVGDGSLLMHGMELQTAERYDIPLIILVINNGALGNVYLRFKNQDGGPDLKSMKLASIDPRHDWAAFAKSMDVESIRVTESQQLAEAYMKAFTYTRKESKPFLIDVICDKTCKTPNMGLPKEDSRRLLGIQPEETYQPWFG